MNINSLRNRLVRLGTIRSATRSRMHKTLNKDASAVSSTLRQNSASKTSSSATQTKQIAMYEKIENAANEIQKNVGNMIAAGKMSYTDDETGKKAQENARESLISGIKSFVSDYNTVNAGLADISGTVNAALKKMIDSVVSADEAALGKIGIFVSKSGELSVDEDILAEADEEKVKALFASEGSFADKISTKMKAIESSAANSITTFNKLYGSTSVYNQDGIGNSYNNGSYYNNYRNWFI